jgi:hypothetical protein
MTNDKHDEIEIEWKNSISKEAPSIDREAELGKQVQHFAYITLLLMALVALLALGTDVSNYIRSIMSARGLSLEITSLQVVDDDNPRALIHFKVRSDSPLEIKIERYRFELHLNGQRVGSSYSTYRGTDPNVDSKAHRETTNINQVLAPGRNIALEFTVYIYSAHMESVRHAQRSGSMSWYASAEFVTVLPHSREENLVNLRAEFGE